MEYQIRSDQPLDREQIADAVRTWLRASPNSPMGNELSGLPSFGQRAWATTLPNQRPDPFVGQRSLRPTNGLANGDDVRQRQRSAVTAPAQNVFSSHQIKTAGEVSIAPGLYLSLLSEMGHQHHHLFVLRDKTLLLIQQDGLHSRWVNLFHGWQQPFAHVLPPEPTPTTTAQTGGFVQAVAWTGGATDPAVSQLSAWQKLLWAAGEGVRQFGPQALEVIKEMLTWEGVVTLLAITGLLTIPYVGQVVLVGLMGAALYDLLVKVTDLFQRYYETAVKARTQADLRQAGRYFAQGLVEGLLDVLGVFAGTAALSRLRALRSAGKLTLRAWVEVVSEQAKQLGSRLRGGVKKMSQYIQERAQRTEKAKAKLRTPRPMNTLTNPRDMLDEALMRQGKKSGDPYPAGYKETWSENGYDYEVRIHQPPANAPAGSNSANGPTYRVARRKQGTDANGQGYGWEYVDDKGVWHKQKDIKAGNPPQAANDTHIPVPNGTIK